MEAKMRVYIKTESGRMLSLTPEQAMKYAENKNKTLTPEEEAKMEATKEVWVEMMEMIKKALESEDNE